LQRAQHSFEQGDYQFASEVLRELESEGQVDGAIQALRRRVDEALQRQATAGLYESAKRYFDTEEYSLALRKAQEILELDGTHAGAIVLKKKIEDALAERRVAEMLHSAAERLEHAAFTEARKTLQDAQRLRPDDSRVRQLLSEVDSRQKEFLKQRQEQERLYQSSQAAWVQRDISLALMTLERLAELVKQTQEPQDRITEYKDFHKSVRKEHDALLAALDNAKQAFEEGDFNGALALCAQYLGKYPRHEGFAALKFEIEQRREEQQIAYRADVDQRLGNQPNLVSAREFLRRPVAPGPGAPSRSGLGSRCRTGCRGRRRF
jgi:TolA-binding protein